MSKEKLVATMSHQKSIKGAKKRRIKKQKSIQKLFDKLREQSQQSIIVLDDTPNNTVLENTVLPNTVLSNTVLSNTVVSNTEKRESLIVIPDEDQNVSNIQTPKKVYQLPNTSTPNQKNSIDNLLLSRSAQQMHDDIINLTREINNDSYITIDLTTESKAQTVIDLSNATDNDVVTMDESSMSGDSDVTVINMHNRSRNKRNNMKKLVNGIANLDASEKGKLLDLITQKLFSGCNVPVDLKTSLANIRQTISKTEMGTSTTAAETAEDTYIKRVILKQSRNSIGSNIYNPEKPLQKSGLRMIVIDGSNVAMEHGRGRVFSVRGLNICIEYFLRRGHVVKAFVPRFRCKYGKSSDPRLLDAMERQGHVIYTPSREIQGRMITSYDDRYIVQCAAEFDAVIVSGDNYRDLMQENPRWRFVIENRLLPFTWVNDMLMFPRDPLGRNGPSLEMFLKHS